MVYQNFDNVVFSGLSRDVYIYWQEIDTKDICETTLEYQVFCTPVTDNEKYNKTMLVSSIFQFN